MYPTTGWTLRAHGTLVHPNRRSAENLDGDGLQQQVLLWVVLIAAVLVLAVTTLRLARKGT